MYPHLVGMECVVQPNIQRISPRPAQPGSAADRFAREILAILECDPRARERQLARWQRSWYCHRCHVVFVAESAQVVAPEQFGRLIVGSGSAGQRLHRASSRAEQAQQPRVVL